MPYLFALLPWQCTTLAFHARIALHVRVIYGRDPHHISEAQYKAIARALREAVEPDPRVR